MNKIKWFYCFCRFLIRGRKLLVQSFLASVAVLFSFVSFDSEYFSCFGRRGVEGFFEIISVLENILIEETLVKGGLAGRFWVSISSFKIVSITCAFSIFSKVFSSLMSSLGLFVKKSSTQSAKLIRSSPPPPSIPVIMNNRKAGVILALLYTILLFYYIAWTVIIPFVDEGHVLRTYFPDHYYAQSAPILFAYTIFAFTFAYVGIILVRTSPKNNYEKRTQIKMKKA